MKAEKISRVYYVCPKCRTLLLSSPDSVCTIAFCHCKDENGLLQWVSIPKAGWVTRGDKRDIYDGWCR